MLSIAARWTPVTTATLFVWVWVASAAGPVWAEDEEKRVDTVDPRVVAADRTDDERAGRVGHREGAVLPNEDDRTSEVGHRETRPIPNEDERTSEVGHREDPVAPPETPILRDSQPRSPRPLVQRGSLQSIQVNVDLAGQNIVGDAANEPSLAIDPTNPDSIVIGWRQFDTIASDFRQAGYAYSTEGDDTWTFPGSLDAGQFRSDPVLATDSLGRFYYYSLSTVTTTEYFLSDDGGVTWTAPISSPGGDKNWHTVDKGNDHVYAIWNSQFTCCAPGTDFTRSVDRGMTFGGPFVLPQHPKWGTVDAGPDGELYIVGATLNQSSHLILRSDNVDQTTQIPNFALAGSFDLGGTTGSGGAPNPGGLLGQVWVAVDRSTGPTRGNVYVLGSVNPPGGDPLDVHFVRSTDQGQNWSTPIAVNDNPGDGSYQWFGTMSVSPEGRIDVVWNDTRGGAANMSELYYAYSTDAGATWSQGLAVSPAFDSTVGHPQQNKIGDYYDMVSGTNDAALAWSATFNGEQDVYFLRVGDCNQNGTHDSVDIDMQTAGDVNSNGIPDTCEPDCNTNGVPDTTDIDLMTSTDCNLNAVPDECDIASGNGDDCDQNGVLDQCGVTLDLESDPGFVIGAGDDTATTGVWERVDPVGTLAQPEDDHTPDPGVACFVTGQGLPGGGLGDNDVDGGKTTLVTSAFDLTGLDDPYLGYWRWFSNDTGGAPNEDVFTVEVSNNGGVDWTPVETVGPAGAGTSGGWVYSSFRVSDLVVPTSDVRLRFVASDLGAGSLVEAAVDDFLVIDCGACAAIVPAEVQELRVGLSGGTVAELSWQAEPSAETYRVYRGTQRDASDLSCFADGIVGTSLSDDGFVPLPGGVLYYVATAVNCAGESVLGSNRVAASACP